MNHYVQGILIKINSCIIITNHGGQKAVGQHIQSAKKKKKEYQPKILFPVTLCIKNKGKSKEITEK